MSEALSAPERLGPDHDLDEFSCGEPELDSWLRESARRNERNDVSRTFVVCRGQRVVGYYTLAASAVVRAEAPKPLQRNAPTSIPVILLGRLAVDEQEQGSGLGRFLLRDAFLRSLRAGDEIGARAVLVDALTDDAAAFYRRYGFVASPWNERMLFLAMKAIPAAAG